VFKYYFRTILTVRNTDPELSISIGSIKYFDAKGMLIKKVLKAPLILKPFASTSQFFEEGELEINEGITVGSGTGWLISLLFHGHVVRVESR